MEPTLALVFLIASLGDMIVNDCPADGCLARGDEAARYSIASGALHSQDVWDGGELYLRYDLPVSYGPFQPVVGASVSDRTDLWLGAGFASTVAFGDSGWYAQGSLMPGLYAQGDGVDLGHVIEFRSGIELGYEARSGMRIGLSYDHRSNASLDPVNPGVDLFSVRVSIPLN
ncbi:acyloxyacyl hydrolase [Aliiroseovarius sp.]|uniref:acyloxyacyl hydrolase n=1 Tax=Aliiroseovarius sp. TaxID=1872442 RepID=UPI002639D0E1|nr:acyloxyacyl hydrolase [Aliiroseovarius sp.]